MTPETARAYQEMMQGAMVGGLARGGEASDKVSKSQVDYSRGHKDSHCGAAFDGDRSSCRFFVEPKRGNFGTCERVEGAIGRLMWCQAMAQGDDKNTELKAAILRLRRVRSGDADVMKLCDEVEQLIGSPERPRRGRLHPAWGGKLPPEPGETR